MQSFREIIRLAFEVGLSANDIHRSTNVSRGTIQTCIKRARSLNLTWPLPDACDDSVLEKLLYPTANKPTERFVQPDFAKVRLELSRKGVTLTLLWDEYREKNPDNFYCYAHYSKLYRRWLAQKDVVMRQTHQAGEKLFVDFAGQTVPITSRETGEITTAQIFVATFGASNYTYAEACESQDLRNWLSLHVRAFNFFGGVPQLLVPDYV